LAEAEALLLEAAANPADGARLLDTFRLPAPAPPSPFWAPGAPPAAGAAPTAFTGVRPFPADVGAKGPARASLWGRLEPARRAALDASLLGGLTAMPGWAEAAARERGRAEVGAASGGGAGPAGVAVRQAARWAAAWAAYGGGDPSSAKCLERALKRALGALGESRPVSRAESGHGRGS
jgi:hypothetical protein